ncbi:MAG: hypothetical protein A2Y41_01970 [Spirochaetes bacterium GWB1_36_13]|nr:MAG: hypothetical protein A2Y41_01970 [Spirochaetes bacterium GWB1_36_13]
MKNLFLFLLPFLVLACINKQNLEYIGTVDSTAPTLSVSKIYASTPSASGFTVHWTAATDTDTNLQYRVYYSTSDTITTVADAQNNGTPAGSYTAGITSQAVTGLTDGQTYYYTVVVKDSKGNKTVYTKSSQKTGTDSTAPVVAAPSVTASSPSSTGFTVNWTPASDDATGGDSLQYQVYTSTTNNITTVTDAKTNGVPHGGYRPGETSLAVTGLNDNTTYYYTVSVKDAADNEAIYTTGNQKTGTDSTAPTVGTPGLTAGSVSATGLTVNWTAAADDATGSSNLEYLVYISTSDNISTVADAEANGTAVGSYASGITSQAITGLSNNTTYYYTVVVKDAAGNKSIYTKNSQTTANDTIVPTVGTPALTSSSVTQTGLTVNWTAASDTVYAANTLQYQVCYSTAGFTNDVTTAKTKTCTGYETNMTTKALTGLTAGTTYYYTVLVKDGSGNESVYTQTSKTTDGIMVSAFDSAAGADDSVFAVAVQSDGKVIIGGSFLNYRGTAINRIARINTDGTLDTSFTVGTGFDNAVYELLIQSDGKILVGGYFTTYNGTTVNYLTRLNADGTRDTSFNSGTAANNTVTALYQLSSGKILIGGAFTTYNGTSKPGIARLYSDGTLDTAFNNGGSGTGGTNIDVNDIEVLTDGSILIGGTFTSYNGTSVNRIAKLSSEGAPDSAFTTGIGTGFNDIVYDISLLSNGNIVVVGDFTSYKGTASQRIAFINASTGALETAFTSGADNTIVSAAVQSDGKIVIGGVFTNYKGTARNRIARINTDGTLDTSFDPGTGADANVLCVRIGADGKITAGGLFTYFNASLKSGVVKLWN